MEEISSLRRLNAIVLELQNEKTMLIFVLTCPPPFPFEQGAQGGPFIFTAFITYTYA
ncbi:MAG TPA: hypothetical protein VIR29_03870 [Anseongella sp.]